MRIPHEYYESASPDGKEAAWLLALSRAPGMRPVTRAEVAAKISRGGRRILDYGCGSGGFLLNHAVDRYDQALGVDLAYAPVHEALRDRLSRGVQNAWFSQVAESASLPFRNASFDCVVALAVLEHVFWPTDLLGEFHRVLRPGGQLIVEVPNAAWLWHRIEVLRGRVPNTAPGVGHWPGVDDGHIRFFTVKTLSQVIQSTGYSIESITCAGRAAAYRSAWVSVLGADIVISAIRN